MQKKEILLMLGNKDLTSLQQLKALGDPLRMQMMILLMEKPVTGAQLARILQIPRQKAHYHLHILQEAELITKFEEKMTRGLKEIYYIACASVVSVNENNFQNTQIHDEWIQMCNTMINVVQKDLENLKKQPDHLTPSFIQETGQLTVNQIDELRRDFIRIDHKFNEYLILNQGKSNEELSNIRLALILTPIMNPGKNKAVDKNIDLTK